MMESALSLTTTRPFPPIAPTASAPPRRLLIVSPAAGEHAELIPLLEAEGHAVVCVADAPAALELFERQPFHLVVTDETLPGRSGAELLRQLHDRSPLTAVVVLSAHPSTRAAVSHLKQGAADYLGKPMEPHRLRQLLCELAEKTPDELPLRALEGGDSAAQDGLVVGSRIMRRVLEEIRLAAAADGPVLVCGESGTGKELVARSIHRRGPRAHGPLLTCHVGTTPADQLLPELLGVAGADGGRPGLLEAAAGGTLVLDEVTALEPAAQVALLGLLETRRFRRTGGGLPELPLQARLVLTAHRDPAELVHAGRFREDLYYRLSAICLRLPPLRERREEVALLAQSFAERCAARLQRPRPVLPPETIDLLLRYAWPGNVRELRNVVEQACLQAADGRLTPALLPRPVAGSSEEADFVRVPVGSRMKDVERTMIARTLDAHHWNKQATARILGISRRSLYNKLERYKISRGSH